MIGSGRQPNLLPKRAGVSRPLLAVVIAVPATIGFVLVGAWFGDGSGTAAIAKRTPTPVFSASISPTPPRSSVLSQTTVTGLARGLGRDTVRWFDEQTGYAYEGNLRTGAVHTISEIPISGFLDGIWVPGEEGAFIVSDEAGNGRTYRLLDYRNAALIELEPDISALAVSADGSRIAYVVPGSDASFLIKTARIDGSDAVIVLRTRLIVSVLAWQTREQLLVAGGRQAGVRTDLLSLTTDGAVVPILTNKTNLEFAVSDRGSLLVSYYDDDAGVVAAIDPATARTVPLIEPVSARKCGWLPSGAALLCGIVQNTASSRGSSFAASQDSLKRIDAVTGVGDPLLLNEKGRVNVFTPVISSSGAFAAFIDLFDRRVHTVEL